MACTRTPSLIIGFGVRDCFASTESYWVNKTEGLRRDSYQSASSTRFHNPSLS
jgi:hypothetical protein